MVFCIEKFSSALCLAHGTHQSFADLPEQCYNLTENSIDVYDVISKLSKIFQQEFRSILRNILVKESLEWFDLFIKANLSRYIKISENATYFQFMVLCSLIHTISSEVFRDLQCFTSVKIISLCLRVVYDRCYKDQFEKESEGLGLYCKRINIPLLFEDGKSLLSTDFKKEIKSMLQNIRVVGYKNFELTDLEERMLHDSLDLVPAEGIPVDSEVSTNMPCKPPSATDINRNLADEIDIEMKMDFLNLDENSPGAIRICDICDGKCFTFLSLYQNEITENIKS
ncbi:hypothetical protein AVEN_261121-1 [Araneus ventricosus]|uniref:Uncharacterized protein n=1 Tax=Araneus ventricosus TaxID=182803 RepID=A0A4Y2JHN6_ARAVE|nr:hypothetical protein AVEN_261121-1 [Araneus ventricosus]